MAPNKISIEGNIGCGKSTVISRLCKDTRLPIFLEPVDEWGEWLSLFYEDPSRWGLSFNLTVLMSFLKWKDNNFPAIYERSPLSNRRVFTQLQYEQGRMNNLELKLFDKIYNNLEWMPEVVIYIRTDPEVCMSRMKTRGRDCEKEVPLDYLSAVHNKYEELFPLNKSNIVPSNTPRMVHIINGNRPHDEVYEDVLALVRLYTTLTD